MDDEKYAGHFETLIHEVHHILGLNPTVFPFFRIPDSRNLVRPMHETRIKIEASKHRGKHTGIILPGLVELARKYFNCTDIQYVPLEDEGGPISQGSHFEKLWFGNEMMIADDYWSLKLSVFTLKFLEETGWYKPQY